MASYKTLDNCSLETVKTVSKLERLRKNVRVYFLSKSREPKKPMVEETHKQHLLPLHHLYLITDYAHSLGVIPSSWFSAYRCKLSWNDQGTVCWTVSSSVSSVCNIFIQSLSPRSAWVFKFSAGQGHPEHKESRDFRHASPMRYTYYTLSVAKWLL